MSAKTLDVRLLPPPQKHPAIFDMFTGLAAGEAMTLINDHDPRPLYYQFAAVMPDQFEWRYVEQGPEVWRIEIVRK